MEYKLYEKFKTPNEYLALDEKIRPIYNIFRRKIYLDNGVSNVTTFCVDFEKMLADPIGKNILESAVYTDASANLYFRQHRSNWQQFTDFIRQNEKAVMISAPGSRYIAVIMPSEFIDYRKTVVIWVKDMENDTQFEYHAPSHA